MLKSIADYNDVLEEDIQWYEQTVKFLKEDVLIVEEAFASVCKTLECERKKSERQGKEMKRIQDVLKIQVYQCQQEMAKRRDRRRRLAGVPGRHQDTGQ